MPMYATLGKFTQQGIEGLSAEERARRAQTYEQLRIALGIRQVAVVFTMGQYDVVSIDEAPDDETMTKYSVALSKTGFVRTETLRGFTRDEWAALVSQVP
ncbi:MAG: GYD domain-containing protein [Dehalococcoidia bacterium]